MEVGYGTSIGFFP